MHQAISTLILQLAMASLAVAAPTMHVESNAWQYGTGGGIVGLIVLILDIIVFGKPRHIRLTAVRADVSQSKSFNLHDQLRISCCGRY